MTNKTIFVMGCSFSHHDVYVDVHETWPFLLQQETGYKIINGSIPGNSNISYFYRLKEMEKKFGTPDKTIIQITGFYRYFQLLELTSICNLEKYSDQEYYYDPYVEAYNKSGFTFPYSINTLTKSRRKLYYRYGYSLSTLREYVKFFGSDANTMWTNLKELLLISLYFKDTVFFSWNNKSAMRENHFNINYIGDLQNDIFPNTFDTYSVRSGEDPHFGISGHKAVKDFIKKYV